VPAQSKIDGGLAVLQANLNLSREASEVVRLGCGRGRRLESPLMPTPQLFGNVEPGGARQGKAADEEPEGFTVRSKSPATIS